MPKYFVQFPEDDTDNSTMSENNSEEEDTISMDIHRRLTLKRGRDNYNINIKDYDVPQSHNDNTGETEQAGIHNGNRK